MEERILDIIFYLVQHLREHNGRIGPFKTISSDLKTMGFTESEISSAYGWFLNELQRDNGKVHPLSDAPQAARMFSVAEMEHFTTEAAGFLLQLLQVQLIKQVQFEHIVDRVAALGNEVIDLDMIRIIASRYVFSSGAAVDLNLFNLDGSEALN